MPAPPPQEKAAFFGFLEASDQNLFGDSGMHELLFVVGL